MTALAIPEAHCRATFHPDWPLHQERGPNAGAVSQHIPGSGGSVFLHYGPDSTLESYVGAWRERYGSAATVAADHQIVTADGLAGRSITLRLDEEVTSRMGEGRRVTPPQTLVCNGYTIGGIPVLLGYLVPQPSDQQTIDAADAILASLQQLD